MKMFCTYCGKKLKKAIKEHFIPKSIGGKIPGNIVPSCEKCNAIKNRFAFWSVNSAREFIKHKNEHHAKGNYDFSYHQWLSKKISRSVMTLYKRLMLIEALDFEDKDLNYSEKPGPDLQSTFIIKEK